MKKLLVTFSAIIICGLNASAEQKRFVPRKEYKFTDGQALMIYTILDNYKKMVVNSDQISAKQAGIEFANADTLQKIIFKQYSDTLSLK